MLLNYRIGILVSMLLGTVGCEQRVVETATEEPANVLRLKNAELFTGDTKRLIPHLRLAAFANVKYDMTNMKGRLYLKYKIERWAHGKVLPGYGDGDWSGATVGQSGEVSISLKGVTETDEKLVFDSVVAITSGESDMSGRGTVTIPWKKPANASMTLKQKTISDTIECPKEQATTVWGYYGLTLETANKMMHRTDNKTFEELAKEADWAVLFQLKWKEWSPNE